MEIESAAEEILFENKMDIVGRLHSATAQQILLLLENRDLSCCWRTCKQWRNLMNNNYFWKLACKKNSAMENKIFLKSGTVKLVDYWKTVYKHYVLAPGNWRRGLFKELKYSQYNFLYTVYLDEEILVGLAKDPGSDYLFVIINNQERKVQCTIELRVGEPLISMKMMRYKHYLLATYYHSCPHGMRISIINLKNKLVFHLPLIRGKKEVRFHENMIGVHCFDKRLLLMDVETKLMKYECVDVRSFGFVDGKLATFNVDNTVNLLNLKTYIITTLFPCKSILLLSGLFMVSDKVILTLCASGHICCWNPNTQEDLQHFSITFDRYYEGSVFLHGEKLIYYDVTLGTTQVWNVLTGHHVFVIKKLFYLITWNTMYMVGVEVGEQTVDVRCFNSGRLIQSHINGMNISASYAAHIVKLFCEVVDSRHEIFGRRALIVLQSTLCRHIVPEICVTDTCLAAVDHPKGVLDSLKGNSNVLLHISVLNFAEEF